VKFNFLFLTKLLVCVFVAFCAFGFVVCSDDDDGPTVASDIVGTWFDAVEGSYYTFKSDGTFE